jgi:hypothetical protein
MHSLNVVDPNISFFLRLCIPLKVVCNENQGESWHTFGIGLEFGTSIISQFYFADFFSVHCVSPNNAV